MSRLKNTLYLFTIEYPYGNKNETFLETEIFFLAQAFDNVIIIPSVKTSVKRVVPINVVVMDDLASLSFSKYKKIIQLIFHPFIFFQALYSEIKAKGFKNFFTYHKYLIDYLACELIKAKILRKNKNLIIENSIFYTYWFCNSTLAVSILKTKCPQIKFVSRAHGYDLYDERWGEMGLPFRLFQTKNIDKIYCISKKGLEYFRLKVPELFFSKIELSYLGVNEYPKLVENVYENVKTITSCSSLIELKNVVEIVELIKRNTQRIHWVHFGDGPEKENLLGKVKELPTNISFEFKGHVHNKEVVKFYQNNHIDLFVSLSKSEGIPVSMMEAISFGIPVFSTNVGGVAEIVLNGKSGFLIELNDDLETKREAFIRSLTYVFKKEEIISFYKLQFSSKTNYSKFIEKIMSL